MTWRSTDREGTVYFVHIDYIQSPQSQSLCFYLEWKWSNLDIFGVSFLVVCQNAQSLLIYREYTQIAGIM